jgi:hypothetical protein
MAVKPSRKVLGGAVSSENAGMSSKQSGENPDRRMSKVSEAMFVNFGLVGPKVRRKA